MKEVAERAGVSITTVSHVLNRTRYVDRNLAARVQDAVTSLGYQPNALARGLRRRETRMLGMVVPDNANPYFAELARSVETTCFDLGYCVILCNSDENAAKERAYVSLLLEKQVDGIIFVASSNECPALQNVRERKVPVVLLDRELKGVACDSIVVNNRHGGRQATLHLINGNHKRIACISGPANLTSARERLQGYRDALLAAGRPIDDALIRPGTFHIENGYSAMQDLLDLSDRPTAVFISNDIMAVGALRAIAARRLRVPDDIAVVGFDDITLALYTQPQLTTVMQPLREMGKLATELLVARVNGDNRKPKKHRLKTKLIIRGSCGISPIRSTN
jgi:LacI family transcriptional regulator